MQYEISNEIEKMARGIIKQHHPDLTSKNIVYVFQARKDKGTGEAQAQMRKGKPILADVKIVGGLNAFLVSGEARTDENGPTPFVVMIVSKHAWNLLKPEQRQAMIDEQLCRVDYDIETGRPALLAYDVNAFSLNVKRYGAWHNDLATFLKVAKQHPLFEDLENQPDPQPVVEQTASAEAKQQVKVLKAGSGNGAEKVEPAKEAPKPNELRIIKQKVAERSAARATK